MKTYAWKQKTHKHTSCRHIHGEGGGRVFGVRNKTINIYRYTPSEGKRGAKRESENKRTILQSPLHSQRKTGVETRR